MKHPKLKLEERDGRKVIVGDTFMFVRELMDMGFEYTDSWVAGNDTDLDEFEKLVEKCKTTDFNSKYELVYEHHAKRGYYLSGATYKLRENLKELGGIWKSLQKRWFFRDDVGAEIAELQKKLTEKKLRHEKASIAKILAERDYQKMLAENAEEIADVVKKAFATEEHPWWPLTEEQPTCSRCGFHIIWDFYVANDKNMASAVQHGRGFYCRKCGVDWSK
jgi:hypothetical protein